MKRDGERGFAMLIVFLMAAAVALMFYQQIPRIAFESQREKEQLLIDRGEQYKRAIQLYVVAFKKYPAKIEDLENTNNQRFLRRRYIDPMTGKDEWRLIHVNASGQLTDSLVQKPPNPAANTNNPQSASGATGATGPTGGQGTATPDAGPQVNAAVLRRPSDQTLTGIVGTVGTATPPNVDPNDPKYWPPITLTPATTPGANPAVPNGPAGIPGFPGSAPLPGQLPNQQGVIPTANPGLAGTPGYQPPVPGQMNSGQNGLIPLPGVPGQAINPQTGMVQPQLPGAPQPGFPQAGMPQGGFAPPGFAQQGPAPPPNAAVGMINQALTTPRPDPTGSAFNNTGVTGGGLALAGVASTFKGPSIKVYKDRQKYQEWEFIFDLKQGLPGQQQQRPQQQNPGQNPAPGTPPQTTTPPAQGGPPGTTPNQP
jgi:type II secretory pathway pseudopilin PulG